MLLTTLPTHIHAPHRITDTPKAHIPSREGPLASPAANARWYASSLVTLLSDHLLTLPNLSQKCDGSKPVCQQCTKANRAADCEYDDGKSKTRTQLLQEKIQRLESRIHQLEGVPSLPPQQQQHSSNPRPPLQYSASAQPNLVDVPLHSSALASYASGHPNPISVYGSPRNTPSPPNRQSYFDENIFSTAPQPTQQFPGDVFLDPTSADPLSLGEPLLPYLYPFPFPFPNTLFPAYPPSPPLLFLITHTRFHSALSFNSLVAFSLFIPGPVPVPSEQCQRLPASLQTALRVSRILGTLGISDIRTETVLDLAPIVNP